MSKYINYNQIYLSNTPFITPSIYTKLFSTKNPYAAKKKK